MTSQFMVLFHQYSQVVGDSYGAAGRILSEQAKRCIVGGGHAETIQNVTAGVQRRPRKIIEGE